MSASLLPLLILTGMVLYLLRFILILVILSLKYGAGDGPCLPPVKQETPAQLQCWLSPAAGEEGRAGKLGSTEDMPDAHRALVPREPHSIQLQVLSLLLFPTQAQASGNTSQVSFPFPHLQTSLSTRKNWSCSSDGSSKS